MLVNFIIIASLILIIVVELKFNSLTHLWFYSSIKQLVISLNAEKERFRKAHGAIWWKVMCFCLSDGFFIFLSRFHPNAEWMRAQMKRFNIEIGQLHFICFVNEQLLLCIMKMYHNIKSITTPNGCKTNAKFETKKNIFRK